MVIAAAMHLIIANTLALFDIFLTLQSMRALICFSRQEGSQSSELPGVYPGILAMQ